METIDRRTRFDRDVVDLDPDSFFTDHLPALVERHGHLAAAGFEALRARPLTVEVDGFRRTLAGDRATITVIEGGVDGAAVVELAQEQFSDWAHQLRTFSAMRSVGELRWSNGSKRQLEVWDDHPTLPRLGYVDLPMSSPLYPFGHGLSYTDFELDLVSADLEDSVIDVRAVLRNVGERRGTAVVQLYARDEGARVVRPVRQLADFARVEVEAGETQTLRLHVPLERLAYTWPDGRRGVEAGPVTMLLGLSSAEIHGEATVDVPELILEHRR